MHKRHRDVSSSLELLFLSLEAVSNSVHGIFQSRILEWVAISFSRGSSQTRDLTCVSCVAGKSLECLGLNIACFLYGDNFLFLRFVVYSRYLPHCFDIHCVFERLCSAPKIEDLSGILIWDLHGEVHINISCTYCRIACSFRCISHSCFPRPWEIKCGLAWNSSRPYCLGVFLHLA